MTEYFLVRNITDEFLHEYNEALRLYAPQSCEYAYANLYAWQNSYDTKIARLPDGSFSVLFTIAGEYSFLPPVGKQPDMKLFLDEIVQYCRKNEKRTMWLGGFLE